MAPVAHCTPRATPRDTERAAEDLRLLLQAGELPGSRQRTARMLLHADAVGPDAFAGLSLHGLGFERCAALLLQLLLPLPLNARSAALAQLQSKLASQLLSYLGTSLERVMESERACQVGARFVAVPQLPCRACGLHEVCMGGPETMPPLPRPAALLPPALRGGRLAAGARALRPRRDA